MSAFMFLKDQMALLALAILILLVLAVLALVVRAATRNEPAQAPTRRAAPRLRSGTLRSSFRQAVELIEANLATRAQRYSLPWVLVLDEGDGRATLPLAQAGIASALGTDAAAAAATPGLTWHFFDKGVVIDVQGAYLGGADENERHAEQPWDEFLSLCRDYRPERPFDALVLTVPAALLVDDHPDARLELANLAKRANRRLWLAQNRFAMRFGIYLTISGVECLPGFSAFARALPSTQLGGMLGWSSPYDLGVGYQSRWVEEALSQTCAAITDASAEIYASAQGTDIGTDFFLLPSRVQALQPQLQLYVDELMRPSSYHEPFILRGIYLCGDAGEAATHLAEKLVLSPVPLEAVESLVDTDMTIAAPPTAAEGGLPESLRQPAFLRDLFEQKIFAEVGLTRPSGTQHLGRPMLSRSLRWIAWGIAAGWGVGLVASGLVLHRQVDVLQRTLGRIQHDSELQLRAAQLGQTMPADWQRERTLVLLQLMEQTDNMRLWSVFMPGSWPVFDDLPMLTRERLERAFEETAVDALRQGLYERTARLTGVPRDSASGELIAEVPCGDPVLPATGESIRKQTLALEELPEFSRLLAYVAAVEQIDQATQALQRLLDPAVPAEGSDLSLLVRVILGTDLPGGFDNAASLFRSRAARDGGLNVNSMQVALQCSLRRSVAALDRRAFTESDLLSILSSLNQRIDELAAPDGVSEGEAAAPEDWRALLEDLSSLEALFSRGGGAWMTRPNLQPGPDWERILARISALRLLGPASANQVRLASEAAFSDLHTELQNVTGAELSLAPFWSEKDARWISGDELHALREALQNLLSQPWMTRGPERTLDSGGQALVSWDLGRLDKALSIVDLRKRVDSEHLTRFPQELRPAIEQLVKQQLALQAMDHLANALIPGGRQLGGDMLTIEGERSRLTRLQAVLIELGAPAFAEQLRGILQRDAAARLRALDQALDRADLYAPQGRNFSAWQGEKGPVLAAYAMPDVTALAAYLGQQRSRAEVLGREAEHLLGALGAGDSSSMAGDRWSAIVHDLERYRLKNPNSSLFALEGFLVAMSGDIDATNCSERLSRLQLPTRGGDFFASRHQQLGFALQQRCRELRGQALQVAWEQFAGQFNQKVAGRPPFAVSPWSAEAPALEHEELISLLQSWDRSAPALRSLTGDNRQAVASARRFVEQFDRHRAFLAPLMPAEDGSVPGYDLTVEFRAQPGAEVEGNKVIDWRLSSGTQQLGWREPPKPIQWKPGQPITLTLRLAKDGPAVPRTDEQQPSLKVQDRTVTLRYADPWALMSLLARHRETDLINGRLDARGQQLLRFEFPLTLLPDANGNGGSETRARVYMRLGISPAGKRSPLPWPGVSPTQAPDLP
jgi:type VI secretion system protein ImpL